MLGLGKQAAIVLDALLVEEGPRTLQKHADDAGFIESDSQDLRGRREETRCRRKHCAFETAQRIQRRRKSHEERGRYGSV
jgi:hypothetical protein